MKVAYGLIVCERLVARLRTISEQAGHPDHLEKCLFDARILQDLLEMRKVALQKCAAKHKAAQATNGKFRRLS